MVARRAAAMAAVARGAVREAAMAAVRVVAKEVAATVEGRRIVGDGSDAMLARLPRWCPLETAQKSKLVHAEASPSRARCGYQEVC